MAALGFAFLLCMTMSVTIGSETVASNQEKMRQFEDRISSLEASIPLKLQLEIEQLMITVLDEVEIKFENFARTNNVSEIGEVLRNELQTLSARTNNASEMGEVLRKELQTLSARTNNVSEMGEVLRKEFQSLFVKTNNISEMGGVLRKELQTLTAKTNNVSEMGKVLREELQTLLSNHTLSMADEMKNQTLLINKLSSQLVDVQSVLTCTGEPPSPQNGSTVHFERTHGSVVLYRCDVNFDEAENSTVHCHLGKWEGRPPLCTPPATPALYLRFHLQKDSKLVTNVSCSGEENGQHLRFSRLLDTGTGWALPTDARTYTKGRVAVLDLSGVPDQDKRGVFQCGHVNRTGSTFLINIYGGFDRPRVASVGDHVTQIIGYYNPSWRWLHDGQRVPAWDGRDRLDIAGVRKEDAGIYEWYREGRRIQDFLWLVVRGCPAGFFGQHCEEKCPDCQNGGLCEEKLGTCVCPAGFGGPQCEEACGRNRVGADCSEACDGGDCSFQLFCQPDPYGCSCAAGYWAHFCQEACYNGQFGADCQQTCHCQKGSCDPFTGACSEGCSKGWTGASCQIPVRN